MTHGIKLDGTELRMEGSMGICHDFSENMFCLVVWCYPVLPVTECPVVENSLVPAFRADFIHGAYLIPDLFHLNVN